MTTVQKVIKYCAMAFAVFLAVSIIGGIVGAFSAISYLGDGRTSTGEMQTYTVTGDVESLLVEMGGGKLELQSGESFSVESDAAGLRVENQNGVLTVKEERSGVIAKGVRLILTVPEGFVFERADISAGAGELTADALLTKRLSLELGAGEADIGNLTATDSAKIDSGAGELRVRDGELANLELNMGVGEADLTCRLRGDCALDYGVGELELTLAGTQADYRISLDKGVGTASLDGVKMSGDTVYGGGETNVSIDGGVGELRIAFAG